MKLLTKRLGEITYTSEEIVQFPLGIPGFRDLKNFLVIPFDEESPIYYLQSVDDGSISFIITDPFYFFPEYEVDLSSELLQDLDIVSESEVVIYSIVTVNGPFAEGTANLLAPLVVNRVKRIGKQYVSASSQYSTKHRLFGPRKMGGTQHADPK